jgi:putative membrane protein
MGSNAMNRRNLFAGLSGAAILPLAVRLGPQAAFAQPASPRAPTTPIGEDDYKRLTLMAGTLAKRSSELAMQKAGNAKVKQFASFEVAEQTAIAQALTSQQNPAAVALDDKRAAALQSLQGASGASFDKAYVAAQIDGHSELLGIQDAFLKGKGQEAASLLASDTAHIATLAKAVIEMHLAMLKDLNDMLRG